MDMKDMDMEDMDMEDTKLRAYGDLEQEDKGSVDGDLSKKDEILNEVTFKARRMRMRMRRMRRMMGTETTYGPGRLCQHVASRVSQGNRPDQAAPRGRDK